MAQFKPISCLNTDLPDAGGRLPVQPFLKCLMSGMHRSTGGRLRRSFEDDIHHRGIGPDRARIPDRAAFHSTGHLLGASGISRQAQQLGNVFLRVKAIADEERNDDKVRRGRELMARFDLRFLIQKNGVNLRESPQGTDQLDLSMNGLRRVLVSIRTVTCNAKRNALRLDLIMHDSLGAMEDHLRHGIVSPDRLAVMNGLVANERPGRFDSDFTRQDGLCEVAVADEEGHDEDFVRLDHLADVTKSGFLFPEAFLHFAEQFPLPNQVRRCIARRGALRIQMRTMRGQHERSTAKSLGDEHAVTIRGTQWTRKHGSENENEQKTRFDPLPVSSRTQTTYFAFAGGSLPLSSPMTIRPTDLVPSFGRSNTVHVHLSPGLRSARVFFSPLILTQTLSDSASVSVLSPVLTSMVLAAASTLTISHCIGVPFGIVFLGAPMQCEIVKVD